MQCHGVDVDVVDCCQLSNHLSYPKGAKGQRFDGAHMADLAAGLQANGLDQSYECILTGFLGTTSFAEAVVSYLEGLFARLAGASAARPLFIADPVLGDNGRLYVPEAMVRLYVERVLPLADLVTPNETEARLLTGVALDSLASLHVILDRLHAACQGDVRGPGSGPATVVVTSLDNSVVLGAEFWASAGCDASDTLAVVLSHRSEPGGTCERTVALVPRIQAHFSGTGDLLAGLLAAWYLSLLRSGGFEGRSNAARWQRALVLALGSMAEVLDATVASGKTELRLVKARHGLVSPREALVPRLVALPGLGK